MEITERLLRYEIQHLEQKLCAVTDELIVLQKFVKQQFGKKFIIFRASQQPIWSKPISGERISNLDKKHPRKLNRRETNETEASLDHKPFILADPLNETEVSSEVEEVEMTNVNEEGCPKSQWFSVNNPFDSESESESDENLEYSIRPLVKHSISDRRSIVHANSNNAQRRGGRVKDPVWTEFSNETGIWTCNYCDYTINNPQVDRLKKHLRKCPNTKTKTIMKITPEKSKEMEHSEPT